MLRDEREQLFEKWLSNLPYAPDLERKLRSILSSRLGYNGKNTRSRNLFLLIS